MVETDWPERRTRRPPLSVRRRVLCYIRHPNPIVVTSLPHTLLRLHLLNSLSSSIAIHSLLDLFFPVLLWSLDHFKLNHFYSINLEVSFALQYTKITYSPYLNTPYLPFGFLPNKNVYRTYNIRVKL